MRPCARARTMLETSAETVELLLDEEADPEVQDASGRTALDVTRRDRMNTRYVIQLLGLDLERVVVEENRLEVAKLLGE